MERMNKGCQICGRTLTEGSKYCYYHEKSLTNLLEAFPQWKMAMDIDWEGFLKEVIKNPQLGEWAKEVSRELIERGNL